MSTKIYNAFELEGEYNIIQLNSLLNDIRTQFTKRCELTISNLAVREFLTFYYIAKLHGDDSLNLNFEGLNSLLVQTIFQYILNGDMNTAWMILYSAIVNDIKKYGQNPTPNSPLDFRCSLQILPLENKILVIYYGPFDLQHLIKNNPLFHEYSYDDNRPDNISNEEWKIREFDWEKAIGPDYIPSNHGWNVSLFNIKNITPIINPSKIDTIIFPDDNEMIQELCKTFEEKSNIAKMAKSINTKINFIHDKKDFCNLLGYNTKNNND